jgi:hypothetical protein
VSGDRTKEHLACGYIDEKPQLVAAEGGVDGGEVTGDRGMGLQEI